MPNINLIQQKRLDRQKLDRKIRSMFFLMSGFFVAAVLLFTVLWAQLFAIKAQIRDAEVEIAKLEPTIERIQEYEARFTQLQPKIELLTSAREHTMKWYTYLQVVARTLPQNAYLTRVAARVEQPKEGEAPPNATVTVSGITASQQLVGEAMLGLNRYPQLLKKVNLGYTRENIVDRQAAIEFEIETEIDGLPAYFEDRQTIKNREAKQADENAEGGSNANSAKS